MGNTTSSARLSYKSTADEVADAYNHGRSVSGKTVLVTGGNSGLGFETARVLASCGANVIIACRSKANADDAVQRLQAAVPKAKVDHILLDLSDLKQMKTACDNFISTKKPLHILVNNAGVMACPFSTTTDGYELQFGTNHLGHFALTQFLLPALKATARQATSTPSDVRVVNLSSMGNFIFEQPEGIHMERMFERHGGGGVPTKVPPSWYDPWAAYGQSKLANILHAKELQARMDAEGCNVTAVSLHPGAILSTNLSRHMSGSIWSMLAYGRVWWFGFFAEPYKTIPQGSATTVMACVAPVGPSGTAGLGADGLPVLKKGAYYADCAEVHLPRGMLHPKAGDAQLARRLWELSEKAVTAALR